MDVRTAILTGDMLFSARSLRAMKLLRRSRPQRRAETTNPRRQLRLPRAVSWKCQKKVSARSSKVAHLHASPCSSYISYISELLILPQGIDGTVLPAIEGDNLDGTQPSKPQEIEHIVLATTPAMGNGGFGLLEKLTFFGLIAGIMAMFFKFRSRGAVSVEKFPV